MNMKGLLTKTLLAALPPDEQEIMIRDFVAWLFPELTPAERQKKVERVAPRLLGWISEGEFGLWLVVLQHVRRLPLSRQRGRLARSPGSEATP